MKQPTVDELWKGFADRVLVGLDPASVQFIETRRAFYAGVWATLRAMHDGVPEDEDQGVAWLKSLASECHAFQRAVMRGQA